MAPRIFVLGDVNLDTLLVPLPPHAQTPQTTEMAWLNEANYWRYRHRGGAWLLTEIINAALACPSFVGKFGKIEAQTYDKKESGVETIESSGADYLSSAVLLGLFPQTGDEASGPTKRVYRVDKFLGWLHMKPDGQIENNRHKRQLQRCLDSLPRGAEAKCDILVLHDRAGYFRHLDAMILDSAIKKHFHEKTWIVWHMYSPLIDGQLWKLFENNMDWRAKTIIVAKMECLRQAGLNLPARISLEQESYLFVKGMNEVSTLKTLAQVRHVVAHDQRLGVLHYDCEAKTLKTSCYYCPNIPDVPPSPRAGLMVGYTSNLIAAIVRAMAWSLHVGLTRSEAGIIAGIKQGAVLDHLHFLNGFGDENLLASGEPKPYEQLFETLAAAAKNNWDYDGRLYHLAALDLTGVPLKTWSRIDGFIKRKIEKEKEKEPSLDQEKHATKIACDVVLRGLRKVVEDEIIDQTGLLELPDTPPVTIGCPFEVHGKIRTAYRDEIDSFSSIRRILEQYLNEDGLASPLSIAVFGPPGSGKSFTVQQILATIRADIAERPLVFNLTQFDKVEDLKIAFHKVQDEALAGKVPLVFFDEFETRELEWLKHFLAPMEDGKFKAGESMYRIGRAVFVFAGGVYKTWDQFYGELERAPVAFTKAKGTDFVSRLRAYLDIKSINPYRPDKPIIGGLEVEPFAAAAPPHAKAVSAGTVSQADATQEKVTNVIMFRRAILLRSLLETYLPQVFDKYSKEALIDMAVVRAFLRVTHYKHEARSMRAIIQMSQPSPRHRFQKSSLPAADQLKMHVDEEEFCKLINEA